MTRLTKSLENLIAIPTLIILFVAAVFWVAAKETIILVANISIWAIGGAFIVCLIIGLALAVSRSKLRLAIYKRDLTQVKRDIILAEVEAQSAIVDLDAKIKAIPLLLDQLASGRALPSNLASITSSAYPLPVIKHYEQLPAEVPPLPSLVRIEDYVRSDNASIHNLFLGIGPFNEQIRGDLVELSHIGGAGTSRWGKSIFLQQLLYQILLAKEPTELYLSDLGGTTFVDFGLGYADTIGATEKMATHLWEIAQERRTLYQATGQGIRGLTHYNQVAGQNLPYVVFACDEVTVAFSESKKLQRMLTHLVTFAGKYGIELILAGQNWKSVNVDSTLRDQFSSRFQFKAMDWRQATILIPENEAKDISVKGRCYAWIPERGQTIELQTPFIEPATLQTVACPVHPILPDDLPVWDISEPEEDEADETGEYMPDDQNRIIELYNAGESLTKICVQIHGYKNQKRIEAIKAVLRENNLIG